MIRPPSTTEWDTSRLAAERRAYLDSDDLSFEEIASQVIQSATVINNRIKPYNDAPLGEEDGRQIIFVVRVAPETNDLLYNARDGMRGRYWQSPDHGFAATKYLIGELIRDLMDFSERCPPALPDNCEPMGAEDIKASLERISAKVWPRENDHNGQWLFEDDQLKVARWENNEKCAKIHVGWWRQSPINGDLEIKGALLGIDRTEYIPPRKRARSCQIHKFGFT